MHAGQPRALFGADHETRVVHPERTEDVLLEVRLERLSAQLLDGLSDPIEVDAVLPALTRIEDERRLEGKVLTFDDAWHRRVLLVAAHVLIPDVVREPGRVRQQVAQRDRATRWAEPRSAGLVEAFKDLNRGQLRQAVGLVVSEAVYDRHVLALNEALLLQALSEFAQPLSKPVRRGAVEEPNHRHP